MYNTNMSYQVTLYHGSGNIVRVPEYGYGKANNDYGLGFYCTMDMELAREWSVRGHKRDGFVNIYSFDSSDLNILDLSKENVLTWISILLENRKFDAKGSLAVAAMTYLKENFMIDYKNADVIYGWRADDSYFAYASDFINGAISVQSLKKAMLLGNLGMQYVLTSRKSFSRIKFSDAMATAADIYYGKRMKRDKDAREGYLYDERLKFNKDDLFITDIMRKEIKNNDPRIQ